MSHIRKRIWKRSDGTVAHGFELTYTDHRKERQTLQFQSKRDADAEKARIDHELEEKTHVSHKSSRSVIDGLRAWVTYGESLVKVGKLERITVAKYKSHVECHIAKSDLAPLILSEVSSAQMQDFVEHLEINLSTVMAKKVFLTLKIGLKYCRKKRWLRVLPTEDFKINDNNRKAGKKVEIPAKQDLKLLLKTADEDITGMDGAIVRSLAYCGLRPSEMRGLRRDGFLSDRNPAVLRITQRADIYGAIGEPKSAAGHRDIPVGPETVRFIKKAMLSRKPGAHNLVFPGEDGEVMSYDWFVHQWWPKLMLRAGLATVKTLNYTSRREHEKKKRIQAKFHPYALRHVAASLWIEMDVKPKRLQTLMGHSSIKITMDTYGHLWDNPDVDMQIALKTEQALG